MSVIPYGRQSISENDIDAVAAVLRSDWLTQGPSGPQFESVLSSYVGCEHAVAVSNATAALHLACLALGVGPGDRVWTSPNTFVASANCALYCGASVDFVDIDPQTYNMSVASLREKLILAETTGCLPKVVIPVHFAGQSCDMREIKGLAVQYGFRVIEDASHAIGGRYLGRPIGNCEYSDIVVFSFHPVKIITTAEGGMALTNNDELAARLRLFRSHGITRDAGQMQYESDGPWYYEQLELGYNYRMTDIQAALGISQMTRLNAFCLRRKEIAAIYDQALAETGLILPWQSDDAESAYHLYPITLGEHIVTTRRAAFEQLRQEDIGVNVHYIPVHFQPFYRRLGFARGDFPIAEKYYDRAISLPMYASLTAQDQQYVIDAVKRICI